jgi:hypothetical protein
MTESSDLRDQAAKCRRFAKTGVDPKTTASLTSLALEYDARALVIEERLTSPLTPHPVRTRRE